MTFTSIFWMKKGRRDPDNLVMKGVDTPWFFCGCFLKKTAFAIAGSAMAKVFPSIKVKYRLLVNGW